jgi:hypothetical protein
MLPATAHELAWFEAGEAVYAGARELERFPPIDDPNARRWWLGGFGSAWATAGLHAEPHSPRHDPTAALCHEDLRAALAVALSDHPRLAERVFAELPEARRLAH